MIRLEHALAAGALACAAVAVAVPAAYDVVGISLGDRPGEVRLDGATVTVRPPALYEYRGSTQDDEAYVRLDYGHRAEPESIYVAFVQRDGPPGTRVVGERDGRPIERTPTGVKWEVRDGVTVLVTATRSRRLAVEVVEDLDVDR